MSDQVIPSVLLHAFLMEFAPRITRKTSAYPVNARRREAAKPDTSSSKTPALQRYLVAAYPANLSLHTSTCRSARKSQS